MSKKYIRSLIGILFSAFFLWLALRGIQWQDAVNAFKQTRYLYIIPALVVYFLALWVRAYRWTFLMPENVSIKTKEAFPLFIIGCFANNVLPLRLGDLYRAYLLGRKKNISVSASFACIFTDKVFDALAVLTFLGMAALLLAGKLPPWEKVLLQASAVVLLSGVVGLWLVLWFRRLTDKLINYFIPIIPKKIQPRVQHIIQKFLDGLEPLKNHRLVVSAFIFSLISWSIEAVTYYILALAMGLNPPLYATPIILAVVNLAMMIPTSAGGVGTFEYFSIKTTMASIPGTAKGLAASYTILTHLSWFIPITVLGLYYYLHQNISFKDLESSANPEKGN